MKKNLIIFDFDGVIVDSYKESVIFLQSLNKKYRLFDLSEDLIQELFEGNYWEGYLKRGVSHEMLGKIKANFIEDYESHRKNILLFPEMPSLIKTLEEQYILAIVSSNHNDIVEPFLREYEIYGCFSDIKGIEAKGNKEEKIKQIINGTKSDLADTHFVSDTSGDIREGNKTGVKTIAVTWGFHNRERLEKANPGVIVESPGELLKYFNHENN